VISPTPRPLPDNTQYSQETSIHAAGGIRTRYPKKRTAADPRLRPRDHLDDDDDDDDYNENMMVMMMMMMIIIIIIIIII
jgi:hypothetical protein